MLFTFPPNAKTFVPFESSVPNEENQSAPLFIIAGILPNVSTLFTVVGACHKPCSVGKYLLTIGSPRLPSIDFISAVPSPQTNAPAPYFNSILKLNPVPNIFSPKTPASSA